MFKLLDGKVCAAELYSSVKAKVEKIFDEGKVLTLALISVGNQPDWIQYANAIERGCTRVGVKLQRFDFDENVSTGFLLEQINRLNENTLVTGIMVQHPLPKHIDEKAVVDSIKHNKDIDGQCYENISSLYRGTKSLFSATALAVVHLLKFYGVEISGANCVILGRSQTVGKPLSLLMLLNDATITVCHRKTKNIKQITKQADIICSAVGVPHFLTADMVKDNAVVVDIGTNFVDGKVCGDVDFSNVKDKVSYISPVPGGVGAVTTAMLISNVVTAYELTFLQ